MQFDKSTTKREITISEVVLKVIQPYAEGHVLSASEANVLNQTLAENLRNNFAGVVKEAKEAAGGADKVDLSALQKELNEYTKEYEFGARRSAGVAVSPVDKIALRMAKEAVRKALVKAQKDPKAYTPEQISEMAQKAVDTNPRFREEAQKEHDARKAAAAELIAEIAA